MDEDNRTKKSDDSSSDTSQKPSTEEKASLEELEKNKAELEELLRSIKRLEEMKGKRKKKPKPPKRVIAIEFGAMFHPNLFLNFMGYYMLNLTIIYTVVELFQFGRFDGLSTVLLFVLFYTVVEMAFRMYLLMHHFMLAVRSLGFVFFLGYLTIFYVLTVHVFPKGVVIFEDVFFIAFVAVFIALRYALTQLFRHMVFR